MKWVFVFEMFAYIIIYNNFDICFWINRFIYYTLTLFNILLKYIKLKYMDQGKKMKLWVSLQLTPTTKLIQINAWFSAVWGASHSRIDNLFICPPNVILDLFRLLAIPYSWVKILAKHGQDDQNANSVLVKFSPILII